MQARTGGAAPRHRPRPEVLREPLARAVRDGDEALHRQDVPPLPPSKPPGGEGGAVRGAATGRGGPQALPGPAQSRGRSLPRFQPRGGEGEADPRPRCGDRPSVQWGAPAAGAGRRSPEVNAVSPMSHGGCRAENRRAAPPQRIVKSRRLPPPLLGGGALLQLQDAESSSPRLSSGPARPPNRSRPPARPSSYPLRPPTPPASVPSSALLLPPGPRRRVRRRRSWPRRSPQGCRGGRRRRPGRACGRGRP